MTSPIHIRLARASDLDGLIALEHHAFTTDRLSRAQYRRHVDGAAIVLVAESAGNLCGSAMIFFRRNSSSARLYSIAVSRDVRGQGVGERLIDAVERAAAERGSTRLRLEVRQDNPAAIRLYEKRGYSRTGAIIGFYEDGADAWRYEKPLGAAG
ncbi:MAG: GNAT family N-acetyltransferase [Rudaea sp.]